jgi:hypothetical protein
LFGCFLRGATKVEVIEGAKEIEAVATTVMCVNYYNH